MEVVFLCLTPEWYPLTNKKIENLVVVAIALFQATNEAPSVCAPTRGTTHLLGYHGSTTEPSYGSIFACIILV